MTMTTDDTTRTRRAFLAAGLGALAAAVGTVIGRPVVAAADGDSLRIGVTNTATATTMLRATAGKGIWAISNSEAGLHGDSKSNFGVFGHSDTFRGVGGTSTTSVGVHGRGGQAGVYGQGEGPGDGGVGVHGHSESNYGVSGTSTSSYAVTGLSSKSAGVAGFSESGGGVIGSTASGIGVHGQSSTGRGGRFSGPRAQIRLDPAQGASHPTSGQAGDLFVDRSKRLWFCKGGTSWKQIA